MRSFKRGNKTFPLGFYTDDTSQAICLSESLVEKGFNINHQFFKYRKWYLHGHATPLNNQSYGIGQHTLKALICSKKLNTDSLKGDDIKAGGNGSLMRSAPIGLYYQGDYKSIKEKSLLSSYVTHNYYIAGCARPGT